MPTGAERGGNTRDVLVRVVRHRPRVRGHQADAERHGVIILPASVHSASAERTPQAPEARLSRAWQTLKWAAGFAGADPDYHPRRPPFAQAFAATFAFFWALRAFCAMKRSVFACASLSTICTGGDFIR